MAEKYEYLYTPEELNTLADTVQTMHGKVRRVYAKFNNNAWNYPIVNALQFKRLLGQEAPDPEALKAGYQPRASRRAGRRAALPRAWVPPKSGAAQERLDLS